MRVVAVVVVVSLAACAGEAFVEGALVLQTCSEVREGYVLALRRGRGGAAEDEEAEGAVEGDLVLEVDGVGVDDAGDVGVWEDAARADFGAVGDEEVVVVGGGVGGGVVEDVGEVGDAVAGGEFAA